MNVVPAEAQLKAALSDIQQDKKDVQTVAFYSPPGWTGSEHLYVDGRVWHVAEAHSVLAVSQALATAEREATPLLLLTDLETSDLSKDVLARLYKQKVRELRSWDALKTRLRVRSIDPSLEKNPILATALMEAIGTSGWLPSTGILTADAAWELLFDHALGMPRNAGDVHTLLRWTTENRFERYLSADASLRSCAQERLAAEGGALAQLLLSVVETGHGSLALPLGLACVVLFVDDRPDLAACVGRLERFTANRPLPRSLGQTWGRVAMETFNKLVSVDGLAGCRRWLQQADEVLADVFARDFAWLSPVSIEGYQQRVTRFGQAVVDPNADGETLQALRQHVVESVLASDVQREQTLMALRLWRWLQRPQAPAATLTEVAQNYVREGALVDQARYKLAGGDDNPNLRGAYEALLEQATQLREGQNRVFGHLLAGTGGSGLLGVERVLTEVVVPLLKGSSRVLFLVLDGLSWPIAHELLVDMEREGWNQIQNPRVPCGPVLATLPSVTEGSRTSLLSGQVLSGDAAEERSRFMAHAELRASCRVDYPPSLFHKKDLEDGPSPTLIDKLGNPKAKLVAVVVNAVDDHLAKDEQLAYAWRVDTIRPLRSLLEHARRNGRVVVMASDHGHILERGSTLRSFPRSSGPNSELSARWRTGQAGDDEIVASGPRVLLAEAVVMPWSEKVRYTARKCGYHGGATPQEMLAPMVVLATQDGIPKGWQVSSTSWPAWWDPDAARLEEVNLQVVAGEQNKHQLDLLLDVTDEKTVDATWIDQLLAQPQIQAQKERTDLKLVRRLLIALVSQNDRVPLSSLSQYLRMPEKAVGALLEVVERLLSPDGFAVLKLAFDRETVVLEREFLQRQLRAAWAVQTTAGDTVELPTVPNLTPVDKQFVEAVVRYGSMTERRLADMVGRRAATIGAMLIHKLEQAGFNALQQEGSGPEGHIYVFHREKL